WDDEIAERKLAVVDAKSAAEIPGLHPAKRTDAMQAVPGEQPLVLRALDRFDAEGRPLQIPLGVRSGMRRPLVLLLPDEKSEMGLRVMALEDDPSGFRWGSMRVINTTGQRVMFNWETFVRPIAPGWRPVDIDPGGADRNMMVRVFMPDSP